jgi:Tol biopolymer transport system component
MQKAGYSTHPVHPMAGQPASEEPALPSGTPAGFGGTAPPRIALTLLMVVISLAAWLSAGIGQPAVYDGRIAFQSDRDGNWELYLMPAPACGVDTGQHRGSQAQSTPGDNGPIRLTHSSAEEWLPKWSPDGSRLGLVSNRDGDWGLYLLDVQQALQTGGHSGLVRLTTYPGNDWDLAWAPDGNRIAFSSLRDGNWEVYVMGLDGRGEKNLTRYPADDWLPAWSPDGRQIAFVSDRDGNWEIYAMHTDGTGLVNLTHNPGNDWVPTWSPDGQHIAFQSDRDGNWEIYVMSSDGSQQTNLTHHPSDDWDPAWSPDSQHIVFMSERSGNRELYVMDAYNRAGLMRLTNNPAADKNPAWAP